MWPGVPCAKFRLPRPFGFRVRADVRDIRQTDGRRWPLNAPPLRGGGITPPPTGRGHNKASHGYKIVMRSEASGVASKPPPIAESAAGFLSAENPPKKYGYSNNKWNQHSNKWLACYLKWIILVISKLLVVLVTDGRRFCNVKETDNDHSRRQSFQFRFNSSAEIVCNQLNFNRIIFVFSRISADFFSLRDNSANPNISRILFYQPSVFFSDCRLGV